MEESIAVPDWLDNDFLTQCLQKEEGKQHIVVTNFTVSPAVPAGNNYGSVLYRVKVEYKNFKDDQDLHWLSLILKSELTEGPMKEVLDSVEQKEPVFYLKFLPEGSKLTKASFAPKAFFSPKSSVVVLEDLKEQGFVMADRLKQLDLDHCFLYAKAAASLHAMSFAVHKKDPDFIESLGKELLPPKDSESEKMFKNMIKGGLNCLAEAIGKTEKFKKYRKIIEDISVDFWDKVRDSLAANKTLNTLTQGDPWTPNMMFQYDDKGAVKEIKLLDFQGLRYGSPVNDLNFFIWTSANHDVRRNRLSDLYKMYLDTFNHKLQELNCHERLTLEFFMESKRKLSPMTLYLVATMIPLFYDPVQVDFKELLYNENYFEKYYTDLNYRENYLPKLLEQMELAGVFNDLEKYLK